MSRDRPDLVDARGRRWLPADGGYRCEIPRNGPVRTRDLIERWHGPLREAPAGLRSHVDQVAELIRTRHALSAAVDGLKGARWQLESEVEATLADVGNLLHPARTPSVAVAPPEGPAEGNHTRGIRRDAHTPTQRGDENRRRANSAIAALRAEQEHTRRLRATLAAEREAVQTQAALLHGLVVDGDLLRDVVLNATPDLLSHEARADLAYRVLTGLHQAGVTVLRGPDSQLWTPQEAKL